jgi:hypothetical protein
VEDELDAVIAELPASTPLVACWSYGALATTEHGTDTVDQTICITTFAEHVSDRSSEHFSGHDDARAHPASQEG